MIRAPRGATGDATGDATGRANRLALTLSARVVGPVALRVALRVAIGIPVIAFGLVACESGEGEAPETLQPFPPPAPVEAATVAFEDFVGSDRCRDCHAEQYADWSGSTHGRAGGEPGPDVILAPFDGTPMRFRDATVVPRRRDGGYEFLVRQDGQEELVVSVDGVIGGGHMLGGGTQGYVTRWADGTERFLAFDWSRTAGVWFCNTGSRLDRGWVPVSTDLSLADCGDWPPVRPVGTVDRFANCQGCHGSQIQTSVAPGSGYRTRYTTLEINCESCHGPGREHVERTEATPNDVPDDLAMPSLVGLDKDPSLALCFGCHALKDVLRPGYLPGEPLDRYFALKFPVLGDEPYLADGRVRSFAYQANHLASACYLDGPMDCVSCHEPHGQGYWDTNKRPLSSPFDDGQCLSCHASKADDVTLHTRHSEDSEGSRCVACHMPYLQHREVGDDIPFARSDHTISIPRPAVDASLGLTGACAQCHQDRTSAELEREAEEWWGVIRPHRPAVRGLLDPIPTGLDAAADALLHPGARDPLAQFQGLSRFLTDHLAPDDPGVAPEVVALLSALADDPDQDVRALALAALHWVSGDVPEVRRLLVDALGRPDAEGVRDRWKLALGFLGDRYRDGGDVARALAGYQKALALDPDDRSVHRALGLLYNATGDFGRAAASLQRSLALDPDQPLTWVNLGIALAGSGDVNGATTAYERALQIDPHEPLAHFNLGNARLRAGDLEGARERYASAVLADPGLARGHFNLARTLIQLERYADALPHARKAVEFEPDNALARQMLTDLEGVVTGG